MARRSWLLSIVILMLIPSVWGEPSGNHSKSDFHAINKIAIKRPSVNVVIPSDGYYQKKLPNFTLPIQESASYDHFTAIIPGEATIHILKPQNFSARLSAAFQQKTTSDTNKPSSSTKPKENKSSDLETMRSICLQSWWISYLSLPN